jgi:hypothetical protein
MGKGMGNVPGKGRRDVEGSSKRSLADDGDNFCGEPLLTRDGFREAVFTRDGGLCVICRAEGKSVPAVDAHHIMDRRLFPDQGYRLSNGASLCEQHHIEAEMTLLSCEQIRAAAGITNVIVPEHLYGEDEEYPLTKWGDTILPDGRRTRGELWDDPSVQLILKQGGVLGLYTPYRKYPRTFHLPWSPGRSKDDRILKSVDHFVGREVIITEKVDGENQSLYGLTPDGMPLGLHARSIDGRHHPSRNWAKNLHGYIQHLIPQGWIINAESMYALHSIEYTELPSFVLVFGIWNEKNVCIPWDETEEWVALLNSELDGMGAPPALRLGLVPVLYRGIWNEEQVKACFTGVSRYGGDQEGYVVRLADSYPRSRFHQSVAKYVRKDHVQDTVHNWQNKPVIPNKLAR